MAIRRICELPEPVLRKKAKKVPSIDSSIQMLIDDMIETMSSADGAGLAAPQVGVSLRLVVFREPDAKEATVLINPEIVKKEGQRQVTEGCLSIPGYFGELTRAETVTAKGLDRHGKACRIKGTGIVAQLLEHETEHLDGILYIDHLESEEKLHEIGVDDELPEEIRD
ncbi:peptide deformylase [Dehalococcoides mccartyi]|jgi:peptide deformylase|uniref:peptide deformylase n=1 Tax=Dehalococcoides mccartyi TaxID=61435 RepID=UPI0026F0C45F|nr:peptide deformylase [Dehalococcoides mccartyi]